MIIQNTAYLSSLILFVLTFVLFLRGIYLEYKHYDQILSSRKTGLSYFILGILSLSLSIFIFLTIENGFSFDTLCFSFGLTVALTFFLYVNNFIRKRTMSFLNRRKVTSPFSAFDKLIKIISNKSADDSKDDVIEDNKE